MGVNAPLLPTPLRLPPPLPPTAAVVSLLHPHLHVALIGPAPARQAHTLQSALRVSWDVACPACGCRRVRAWPPLPSLAHALAAACRAHADASSACPLLLLRDDVAWLGLHDVQVPLPSSGGADWVLLGVSAQAADAAFATTARPPDTRYLRSTLRRVRGVHGALRATNMLATHALLLLHGMAVQLAAELLSRAANEGARPDCALAVAQPWLRVYAANPPLFWRSAAAGAPPEAERATRILFGDDVAHVVQLEARETDT